jgi:dynein heavy chain
VGNSALMTVLRQEVDRFNNLLFIINESLKALILAVKGEVIMSESLEEAYAALLSQKVPQNWKVKTFYFEFFCVPGHIYRVKEGMYK